MNRTPDAEDGDGGASPPPGWSRRRLAVAAGGAVVAAGAGLVVARRLGLLGAEAGALVGGEAPDFNLPSLAGTRLTFSELRGHPVLLNFWATWCAPCKAELPELELLYRAHQDEGLVVLAVSEDADASYVSVRPYVRQGSPRTGPYTFPVAFDREQEVGHRYRLAGLPGSFFVDGGGVVRAVQPGAMTPQRVQALLATVLPPAP